MVVKFFDSSGGRGGRCFINSICLTFCRLRILEFSCIRLCYYPLLLFFKGGIVDSVICASPDTWKGQDLLKIPHELYKPCPFPSPDLEPSQVQQPGSAHQAVPRPPGSYSTGERDHSECELKPKPRLANLRHAVATVIITGVLCGIMCLLMLAAAIYGCTYAAITAQHHEGPLVQTNEPAKAEGKETFDSSPA